jgi:hypothetical protein
MLVLAALGRVELVEIQYRPTEERYVFRTVEEAGEPSRAVLVNRPLGWDRETEALALEDVLEAFRLEREETLAEQVGPSSHQTPPESTAPPERALERAGRGPKVAGPISLENTWSRTVRRVLSAERTADLAWIHLQSAREQIARSAALLREHRSHRSGTVSSIPEPLRSAGGATVSTRRSRPPAL